jgi:hypothetical protein
LRNPPFQEQTVLYSHHERRIKNILEDFEAGWSVACGIRGAEIAWTGAVGQPGGPDQVSSAAYNKVHSDFLGLVIPLGRVVKEVYSGSLSV